MKQKQLLLFMEKAKVSTKMRISSLFCFLRYFGDNYEWMVKLKRDWDPKNVFNHCQSIGSNEEHCCPHDEVKPKVARRP